MIDLEEMSREEMFRGINVLHYKQPLHMCCYAHIQLSFMLVAASQEC